MISLIVMLCSANSYAPDDRVSDCVKEVAACEFREEKRSFARGYDAEKVAYECWSARDDKISWSTKK